MARVRSRSDHQFRRVQVLKVRLLAMERQSRHRYFRLATPRVGIVLAALVAFNPLLIWFSQEARPYALAMGEPLTGLF